MKQAATLTTAANGHVELQMESLATKIRLGLLLTFRYGFWRWGPCIPAVTGDGISPDFIRFKLRIHSGSNDWLGYYLLADNAESDIFLRKFHARHCR